MVEETYVDVEECELDELKYKVACLEEKYNLFYEILDSLQEKEILDLDVACHTMDKIAEKYLKINKEIGSAILSEDEETRDYLKSFAPEMENPTEARKLVQGTRALLRQVAQIENKIDTAIYDCRTMLEKEMTSKDVAQSAVKQLINITKLFPEHLDGRRKKKK